mgnify:CR=1 FL=1
MVAEVEHERVFEQAILVQLCDNFADFFEGEFSADEAEAYKPSAKPYEMAAHRLGVPLAEVWTTASLP